MDEYGPTYISEIGTTHGQDNGPYTDGPTVDRRIVQHLDRRIIPTSE